MTMLVTIDEEVAPFDESRTACRRPPRTSAYRLRCRREDVFRFMHRV